jgi:hypothetical protein
MSRGVQLVLVCEDSQQEAFARRFLEQTGWEMRKIRVEKAPLGKGSGEQFVRERYPIELDAHRSMIHRVNCRLIIMTDGDRYGFVERQKMLELSCTAQGVDVRTDEDRVALIIPTWNIETWLAYLSGDAVDETRSNYPRLAKARECLPMVVALVEMCQAGLLRQPAPPSLTAACQEFTTRILP